MDTENSPWIHEGPAALDPCRCEKTFVLPSGDSYLEEHPDIASEQMMYHSELMYARLGMYGEEGGFGVDAVPSMVSLYHGLVNQGRGSVCEGTIRPGYYEEQKAKVFCECGQRFEDPDHKWTAFCDR